MYAFASSETAHGRKHRPRVLVAIGLVVALLFATGGIAEAQTEQVRSNRAEVVRPQPVVETLRLACAPDFIDGERGVLCQWSEATNPQTRGYKLYRITDGSPRELVATVAANGRLGYFDTGVAAPASLVYGVISVNRSGRLLGRSPAVHVHYGQDIEQIRLSCSPDLVDGQRGVLCRWSEPGQAGVRAYLVYRITNDEPRSLIARVELDGRNGYFDTDVVPGATLTYGVTGVDSDGTVLSVSSPHQVNWPAAG